MKLRKYRDKDGKINIFKSIAFEVHQVRFVLERIHSDLLNKDDTNPIILETAWSRSSTGFRDEFVGGIVRLWNLHHMDRIGASLEANPWVNPSLWSDQQWREVFRPGRHWYLHAWTQVQTLDPSGSFHGAPNTWKYRRLLHRDLGKVFPQAIWTCA